MSAGGPWCIERRYFGGVETITYDEFVHQEIQEENYAFDIATAMLGGRDPYPYNEDQHPSYYVEYGVVNADALREQMAKWAAANG